MNGASYNASFLMPSKRFAASSARTTPEDMPQRDAVPPASLSSTSMLPTSRMAMAARRRSLPPSARRVIHERLHPASLQAALASLPPVTAMPAMAATRPLGW